MGVHQDVTCIWDNSLQDAADTFKEEILKISSKKDKTSDFYTYSFSRYIDYKVYSETIYALVRSDTIMFLWSPLAMALFLDVGLKVTGGDSGELLAEDSIISKFIELPNIEYIGMTGNMNGEIYEVFTIKDEIPNKKAKHLFDNGLINTVGLAISEDDTIHLSMEFLNYQIEKFNVQVEASLKSEDPVPGIEENPFANEYFDHDIIAQDEKRPLGDHNV